MPLDILVIQLLNGLVFSLLLFLMAAGLSLILGLMDVVNLAHGGFYLFGGYIGLTMIRWFGSFWLALLIAPLVAGALGLLLQVWFLRRLQSRHLDQVLFTFGLALIAADMLRWYWGAYVESVPPPPELAGSVLIMGRQFPVYRLSLIFFGAIVGVALMVLLDYTRIGAIVRAGVSDSELVSGLGINIDWVFVGVFVLGTALAALAGVAAGPITNLYPGLDFEILILALVVVVIGGLGTLRGALLGSILVGMTETLGKAFIPEFSLFVIFALMALVLLVRPRGLLGQKEA
ncbi:MAG: branched-chain amino acid ABC transporter permease [Chloroflexi bacterium]|nr:branched-chain amino acid ABC transporter permease [Chloroflexota bacterium]MBI5052694.1 branched-chain amino acid ABC transporter permease [Chloroflexota bacterium]MBI5712891.1 branched-chain amino acid ABC transporter permease [Chloroflexota bacterium]